MYNFIKEIDLQKEIKMNRFSKIAGIVAIVSEVIALIVLLCITVFQKQFIPLVIHLQVDKMWIPYDDIIKFVFKILIFSLFVFGKHKSLKIASFVTLCIFIGFDFLFSSQVYYTVKNVLINAIVKDQTTQIIAMGNWLMSGSQLFVYISHIAFPMCLGGTLVEADENNYKEN